ncbi:lysophospholipid acyltransferase family protein [Kribbia dieselivorans]|uniref:lysophospholipid acyltransferase family protein n=1 Tax=Kribbia dieselivorans TaxID=331526 RepID=UPI00083899B2|nr:lysophospholipid acyltransferase family protein [Kribbia dieselivorans]
MSPRQAVPPVYRGIVGILRPIAMTMTKRDWQGTENIPAEGGFIVAANHVSHVDPILLAHYLIDHDAAPYFLAKQELFDVKGLGTLLTAAGQIPVARGSATAAEAFRQGAEGIASGKPILFYVEGTITRDPEGWPMVGKSGAARVALETGAPVIPVAQWGAQTVLRPYEFPLLRLLPRKTIHMRAGAPVDLDDLRGRPITREVLNEATERIMDAITAQLEIIRGQAAPPGRWDRRKGERVIKGRMEDQS